MNTRGRSIWLGVGVESFSGGYTDNVTQFNPDGDTYQTVAAWVVLGRNAVAARIFGQNAQPSGNHFCTLRPVEQSEFTFSATTGSILVSQLAGGCQYGGPPLGVPVFIAARVDASNVNNRKGWTGFVNAPPLEWTSTGGDVGSGVFKAAKPGTYFNVFSFGGNVGFLSCVLWKNALIDPDEIYEFWRSGIIQTQPWGAWVVDRNLQVAIDLSGNKRHMPMASGNEVGPMMPSVAIRTWRRWQAVPEFWVDPAATITPQAAAGALSVEGDLSKLVGKIDTGILSSVGVLSKETDKNIDGILSFAGIINREVDRNLAGDLDFSGDLAVSKLYSRGVDGNFSFTGVLIKDINKNVVGILGLSGSLVKETNTSLSGSLDFSGNLLRQIDRDLTGTLSFDGDLVRLKSFVRSVDGDITPIGGLTYVIHKTLGGSLSLDGDLIRDVFKLLVGSINSLGDLNKLIYKSFGGTITFDGNLDSIKLATQSCFGDLTLSGFVITEIDKYLAGSILLNGNLRRDIDKQIPGSLSFSGSLDAQIDAIDQDADGVLDFVGNLTTSHIPFVPGSTDFDGVRGPFTARYRR